MTVANVSLTVSVGVRAAEVADWPNKMMTMAKLLARSFNGATTHLHSRGKLTIVSSDGRWVVCHGVFSNAICVEPTTPILSHYHVYPYTILGGTLDSDRGNRLTMALILQRDGSWTVSLAKAYLRFTQMSLRAT